MAALAKETHADQDDGDPHLICLHDVPIVPATTAHHHKASGGPIWPSFDYMDPLRHCRKGVPVDKLPKMPRKIAKAHKGDAVWGGFLDFHFGHFMAEHLPRLPFAIASRPHDPFFFTLHPKLVGHPLPDWIWDVLKWVGLKPAQVHLVTEPIVISRLWAGIQAEMLPNVPPEPEYLDLLEDIARGRAKVEADIVYVTRADFPRSGGAGTAGEAYVVGQLRRLGVPVLDPGKATIDAQMAVYAGAKHLIFAEGSALHGRQLLGRIDQRITVLRRRRGRMMARGMLLARVPNLDYHDVTVQSLVSLSQNGLPNPDRALALYHLPWLHAVLAKLGLDLLSGWDADAFRAAAQQDIAAWLDHNPPSPDLRAVYDEALASEGFPASYDLAHPPLFSRLV